MTYPNTLIHPSAQIGKDVSIEPFAIIGSHVIIGDRCQIHSHAVLEHTELGPECEVYPMATLGFPPQHLKDKGENTLLKVGARSVFREGVTAHRGTTLDRGVTLIGEDCFFMVYSHIAHDCRIGRKVILANSAQLAGHVEVGDHAFISSMAGIHQFVRVGAGAIVSGGSMVSMDVAPYSMAQGDRAEIKGLNLVGLRRLGADRSSTKLLKEAYRTLFNSGFTLEEALQQPALNQDDTFVKTFRDFFLNSKRGFLRPSSHKSSEVEETPQEAIR